MKSRIALPLLFVLIAATAFAQSDAQQSFDKLKTLAGSWEGHVTTVPQSPEMENKHVQATLRVTSMDNAVVTVIDENHHTEDWTYMEPGDKPVHAHIDLQRTK